MLLWCVWSGKFMEDRGKILARNKYEKSSASVHNPIKITTEWIYINKKVFEFTQFFPTERASKQQNFSLEKKQIPIHPHSRAAVIMRNNNIFFSTRKSSSLELVYVSFLLNIFLLFHCAHSRAHSLINVKFIHIFRTEFTVSLSVKIHSNSKSWHVFVLKYLRIYFHENDNFRFRESKRSEQIENFPMWNIFTLGIVA